VQGTELGHELLVDIIEVSACQREELIVVGVECSTYTERRSKLFGAQDHEIKPVMDVLYRKLRCPDHQRIPSYGVQFRDRQGRPIARAGRWVDTPVPAWTTKHHTHPTEKTPKDRSAFGETTNGPPARRADRRPARYIWTVRGPPETGIVVSPSSLTPRSRRFLGTSAAFLTVLAVAALLVAPNGEASSAGGAVAGVAIGAAICAGMVVLYLARRPYIRVVLHPGSIRNGGYVTTRTFAAHRVAGFEPEAHVVRGRYFVRVSMALTDGRRVPLPSTTSFDVSRVEEASARLNSWLATACPSAPGTATHGQESKDTSG
jgi:hypothetical protein